MTKKLNGLCLFIHFKVEPLKYKVSMDHRTKMTEN